MSRNVKPQQERFAWIVGVLKQRRDGVDIYNRDFVQAYGDFTGATLHHHPYGAPRCDLLRKDLREMKRCGLLRRRTTGITGMAGMGFATWVYTYSLNRSYRHLEVYQ